MKNMMKFVETNAVVDALVLAYYNGWFFVDARFEQIIYEYF